MLPLNGCHCPQVQQLRQNVFVFGHRISGYQSHAANANALNNVPMLAIVG